MINRNQTMKYDLYYSAATKEARLVTAGATAQGMKLIGSIFHGNPDDQDYDKSAVLTSGNEIPDISHTVWQHVQKMLYKKGIQDMLPIKLTWPGKVQPMALYIANVTKAAGSEDVVKVVSTPADISIKDYTFALHDPKGFGVARLNGKIGHDRVKVSFMRKGTVEIEVTHNPTGLRATGKIIVN